MEVSAKKHLGQHFLKNQEVCCRIAESIEDNGLHFLEIGPGTGALTQELLKRFSHRTSVIEIDEESVMYLQRYFTELQGRIIFGDFLKMDVSSLGWGRLNVIGNFPYNISTQIIFKVIEHREEIPQVVGMFQREVAQRFAAPPGSKTYGITSVLTQAYYRVEYLFEVPPEYFDPPPKVHSAVIKMTRDQSLDPRCKHETLRNVVKTAFNQRRKTLRNSLKSIMGNIEIPSHLVQKRPEQLSVKDFEEIALLIEASL
ncbi:MAG: 16S rRNA (adenine(1518)-N(6)/adenine(1519)-N(6))-dimethyltransferase RsmA [Flavobacteriales bacterium]